jgi:hypothetical protein
MKFQFEKDFLRFNPPPQADKPIADARDMANWLNSHSWMPSLLLDSRGIEAAKHIEVNPVSHVNATN